MQTMTTTMLWLLRAGEAGRMSKRSCQQDVPRAAEESGVLEALGDVAQGGGRLRFSAPCALPRPSNGRSCAWPASSPSFERSQTHWDLMESRSCKPWLQVGAGAHHRLRHPNRRPVFLATTCCRVNTWGPPLPRSGAGSARDRLHLCSQTPSRIPRRCSSRLLPRPLA
jgi:hypothetical protein